MAIFRFDSVEENIFSFIKPDKGISNAYFVTFSAHYLNDLFQDTDINVTLYKSKYNV